MTGVSLTGASVPAPRLVDARPYLAALTDEEVARTVSRTNATGFSLARPDRSWGKDWLPPAEAAEWVDAARAHRCIVSVCLDSAEAVTWLTEHRYGPALDGFLRLAEWIISTRMDDASPGQIRSWLTEHATNLATEFWSPEVAERPDVQAAVRALRADALALLQGVQDAGYPTAMTDQCGCLAPYLHGTISRVEPTMGIDKAALYWAAGVSAAEALAWGRGVHTAGPEAATLIALAAMRGNTHFLFTPHARSQVADGQDASGDSPPTH